jgi:2-keto-4-pentenoate hydratase
MSMTPDEIERMAERLADARRRGTSSPDAGLGRLTTMAEAEDVQEAAFRILADPHVGYALIATSPTTARLLGCTEPVIAPLLRGALLEDGSTYLLPQGIIGLGAGYCFVLGRPLENASQGPVGEMEAAEACLACHLELQIVGRRVPHGTPLNALTATADLGLDVIHVLGPRVRYRDRSDLASAEVRLDLDGHAVARGRGADTLGAPFGAVAWTSRWLAARGRRLEAGEVVASGSCTGLVRVVPGQRVTAEFGGLGAVTLDLI